MAPDERILASSCNYQHAKLKYWLTSVGWQCTLIPVFAKLCEKVNWFPLCICVKIQSSKWKRSHGESRLLLASIYCHLHKCLWTEVPNISASHAASCFCPIWNYKFYLFVMLLLISALFYIIIFNCIFKIKSKYYFIYCFSCGLFYLCFIHLWYFDINIFSHFCSNFEYSWELESSFLFERMHFYKMQSLYQWHNMVWNQCSQ